MKNNEETMHNVASGYSVTKNAKKYIESLINLTNKRGLIIYPNKEEIYMLIHVSSFIADYYLKAYNESKKEQKRISPELVYEDFFLNWNSDLIVVHKGDLPEKYWWNISFYFSEIAHFTLKLEEASKQAWSSLFIDYKFFLPPIPEKFAPQGGNLLTEFTVELFDQQITIPFDQWNQKLEMMKEGGFLCNKFKPNLIKGSSQKFHGNVKNIPITLQCKQKPIISGSDKAELWILKIKSLLKSITYPDDIYNQLFNFTDLGLTNQEITKRAIFKINKIIDNKLFECPFEILIGFEKEAEVFENVSFLLNLEIFLISKETNQPLKMALHSFWWTHGEIGKKILNVFTKWNNKSGEEDLISLAIRRISKIKISYFSEDSFSGVNLYNFILGTLHKISENFSISTTQNLSKQSKDWLFTINFKKNTVFQVNFFANETKISNINHSLVKRFIDGLDENGYDVRTVMEELLKDFKDWKYKKEEIWYSEKKVVEIWTKVVKILRKDFTWLWSKDDRLYQVVQTVNHLFSLVQGRRFAQTVNAITALNPFTKLSKIFKQEIIAGQKRVGLNFEWIFTTYNFDLKINNFNDATIKIINSNKRILSSFLQKVIQTNLSENTFLTSRTNQNLFQYFEILLLQFDYSLKLELNKNTELHRSFTESPFEVSINLANGSKCFIKLDWNKQKWEIKYPNGQNEDHAIKKWSK